MSRLPRRPFDCLPKQMGEHIIPMHVKANETIAQCCVSISVRVPKTGVTPFMTVTRLATGKGSWAGKERKGERGERDGDRKREGELERKGE